MPVQRTQNGLVDSEVVQSGGDGNETGDIIDAAGNATHKYGDTDGGDVDAAAAATFIKTGIGRVDEAQVTIASDDADLVAGSTVVEAEPAEESDFESESSSVHGTIKIVLRNASDGTEIGDDTDISSLSLSYTARRR